LLVCHVVSFCFFFCCSLNSCHSESPSGLRNLLCCSLALVIPKSSLRTEEPAFVVLWPLSFRSPAGLRNLLLSKRETRNFFFSDYRFLLRIRNQAIHCCYEIRTSCFSFADSDAKRSILRNQVKGE